MTFYPDCLLTPNGNGCIILLSNYVQIELRFMTVGAGLMPRRLKMDNPRNDNLLVAVTAEEKEAIRREADRKGDTMSNVAYEMLKRGSLETLVKSHRAQPS